MTQAPIEYYQQESERLRFRKMKIEDIEAWTAFFDHNEREHFLLLDQNLNSKEKAEQWFELQLKRYSQNDFGHLAITKKDNNKIIGVAGLLTRNKENKLDYEVAYSILPNYWGHGFATEAAMQMKEYAKTNRLHKRIVSWIHPENIYSKNIATKNGLTFKGETILYRNIRFEVWELSF